MPDPRTIDSETTPATRIAAVFERRLAPLARRGLRAMLVREADAFCFRAVADGPDGLLPEDRSLRYTAMSAIGLVRDAEPGGRHSIDLSPILDALASWGTCSTELGDAGLVLWSLLLARDARAEQLADTIFRRRHVIDGRGYVFSSMDMGLLLGGLAVAIANGVGGQPIEELARDVAARLRGNQQGSDLFSFKQRVWRKNVLRARLDGRLGSFASQVYPTFGLASYARATGDAEALGAASRCAARLCELQGPAGQWWWVYHTDRPRVAIRYPVYSVHQDAMGPMALCAVALAEGCTDRYDAAIQRSLDWLERHPECPTEQLVDDVRGVVWRAVQRDDPEHTGRMGLGRDELARMSRAAWLGSVDDRPFDTGFVCRECRPYHLGWILLASAMFAECAAGRR
jgi:hypothetical protein